MLAVRGIGPSATLPLLDRWGDIDFVATPRIRPNGARNAIPAGFYHGLLAPRGIGIPLLTIIVAGLLVCGPGVRPAEAQIDLSGEWRNVVHEDPVHRRSILIGDYTGIPINDAARFKAESWDQTVQAIHERQCIPHPVTYAMRGFPASIRISTIDDAETGGVIAYTMVGTYGRPRTIWMDQRPHPSAYAPHTWSGFSTGQWEGDALVVTTTHIKMGFLLRNGVPTSDRATMRERYKRHGDHLLGIIFVDDPVYLSEPLIRTQDWVRNPAGQPNAWGPCGPAHIVDELPNHTPGDVPHYLPGTNPFLDDFHARHGLPANLPVGGVETIYPEYAARLAGRGEADSSTPATSVAASAAETDGNATEAGIEVLPVQGNVYMIVGAGGNIAAQVGPDGVLLVDTGLEERSDEVLAAVAELSDRPIRMIVNTHAHSDHTGGNEALSAAGARIGEGVLVGARTSANAMIVAHEEVLNAMSAIEGPNTMPPEAWPTDSYPNTLKEIYSNGEGIRLLHRPEGHTNGDSIVHFRGSDVIVTGDVFSTIGYPVIQAQDGGGIDGVIRELNRIIELTIPADWQEGGTMVIPGHGRIADEADVVEYRDMVTIIRDRIEDMISGGMSLDQVREARPTRDYDGRYGAVDGAWTTEMFVEAIYRNLSSDR